MFSIILSIPKSTKYSNPNEVNWESIHSHFEDLFSEDFICSVKPFNGDHTSAKVYFKRKVVFPNRSNDILINNSIPAKITERKEEPNLPLVSSQTVRLPCVISEAQFIEIQLNLEDQFRVKMQLDVTGTNSNVTISGCHPEVLDYAETSLRKWATELLSPSATTASSSAAGACGSSNSHATARRPAARKSLFPDALQDADDDADQNAARRPTTAGASAAAGPSRRAAAELERDLGGPYDFELALNRQCSLRVQPLDITALQCDLMLVTTSCSLSLNYGLARVVAAKSNPRLLQQLCQQCIRTKGNLKFGETHLVDVPPGCPQLPARQILFVALPNDKRLTDSIDAAQFKAVMQGVVARIVKQLADLSANQGIRSVAMTALGANLPYWADQSEDFAHVLAEALHNAREQTGHLRRITVCDLQLEVLATLGRVIEARFRVRVNALNSSPAANNNRHREVQGSELDSAQSGAGGLLTVIRSAESVGGDCVICCSELTHQNPAARFHCNRGRLCAGCVRRFQDPAAGPSDGRCPLCMERYRPAVGSQPIGGNMTVAKDAASSLPGHEGHGTLVVTYTFSAGIQSTDHPSPGRPYRGISRVTYFPDSPDGRAVVRRLEAAFAGRCVFTVGTSATTGMENTITWASVHHKTATSGGPERHGYPDATYLKRISDELGSLGY